MLAHSWFSQRHRDDFAGCASQTGKCEKPVQTAMCHDNSHHEWQQLGKSSELLAKKPDKVNLMPDLTSTVGMTG